MKCFYHSADLDGHCSAAIVKKKYPLCELIGIDYGNSFPWEKVGDPLEHVYMVDFSLQPFSDMLRLNRCCQLIWIDHHIAAIRESIKSGCDISISGRRTDGTAACLLVWKWLFPVNPVPTAVELLGRYDVWDHRDPDVLPFQYGIRLMDTDPARAPGASGFIWRILLGKYPETEHRIEGILEDGACILAYTRQENKKYCLAGAFETEIGGLKCIAVNRLMGSSQIFDSIWDPEKYQAMAAFGLRYDGKWTVSLYSTRVDVDVSVVCRALGGGGHKGAAGFQSDHLMINRDPADQKDSVEVDAIALEVLQKKAGSKE